MTKIDHKELQALWDQLLIQGWEDNISMPRMVYGFIVDAAPILAKLHDFDRMMKYINSLELARCRDLWQGERRFLCHQHPVRAWIYQHSPHLTGFLYSDQHDNKDILAAIGNFKWSVVNQSKANSRRSSFRHAAYAKRGARLFVRARELNKSHDWGTVK